MTIKQMVLKVNDFVCYALFAIVCITAAIIGATNVVYGAVAGVVGLVLFSLFSGMWFAMSQNVENTNAQVLLLTKNNLLLEKQCKLIEKMNRNLEANTNNPFDTL